MVVVEVQRVKWQIPVRVMRRATTAFLTTPILQGVANHQPQDRGTAFLKTSLIKD